MRDMNSEQVEKLMQSLPELQPTQVGGLNTEELSLLRDGVMFRLMADVGLRATEVIDLNVGDVTPNSTGTFDIFIKGGRTSDGRQRSRVPIIMNLKVAATLRDYLVNIRPNLGESAAADAPLFVSARGKRMSYAMLLTWFRHHCELAGVQDCWIRDLRQLAAQRRVLKFGYAATVSALHGRDGYRTW